MMEQPAVELDTVFPVAATNNHEVQQGLGDVPEEDPPRQEFSLPPVDGGKDAWLFLAGCWAVEALVWGFAFSFGVFQEYYSSHEPFAGSGNIAAVGTTTMGTMYILTPVLITLCRLFGRQARWFTQIGLVIASFAIAMSSFCTTVPQLVATQGILFGIGGCFAYSPCVLYIDQWFAQRKGMAYGIAWSASGFGGVVLPLLLESLLETFGFATAMRVWAGILFVVSFPVAFYVKPRLPYSGTRNMRALNMRYIVSRLFALHQVANIIQATGYFLPSIYLPSYARAVFGASTFTSTLTVLVVNISSTLASVIMGSLTDRLHVTTCIIISTVGTTTGVFLIWGLSSSLPSLFAFCAVYGLFAGCWTSIWPGIMREVTRTGEANGQYVDPAMVFGWLCVGRGIGNIASGPLSDTLLAGDKSWLGSAIGGFGSSYGSLIVFTGVTAFLSGSSFFWKRVGLL